MGRQARHQAVTLEMPAQRDESSIAVLGRFVKERMWKVCVQADSALPSIVLVIPPHKWVVIGWLLHGRLFGFILLFIEVIFLYLAFNTENG